MTDLATDITAGNSDEQPAAAPPTPPTTRPEPPGRGGGNQLTRTTVNLTPHTVAALDRMVDDGQGPNRSELINRGVQVLEIVQNALRGNNRLTIKHDDGTEEKIWIVYG